MKKNNIIVQESTEVVLKRSQSLLDITRNILKNSSRNLTVKKNQELTLVDDNFILIKAGSFMMGSEDESEHEKPVHQVNIKKDFYMCKYQVTMKEYMDFANESKSHYPEWAEEGNSYNLKTGYDDHYKGQNFNDDAPVMGIAWEDAKAYCSWRSKKEGKNYKLPTEAQWEYACRAGTTTKYSFGDESSNLKKYAWYNDNAKGKAHPVGDKKPNPWGLYDMHGNVWEWCEDEWSDDYETTPRDGSANKSGSSSHVVRGGSWVNDFRDCRSSDRNGRIGGRNYINGFRVVVAL